jgi:hypothetical protein
MKCMFDCVKAGGDEREGSIDGFRGIAKSGSGVEQ